MTSAELIHAAKVLLVWALCVGATIGAIVAMIVVFTSAGGPG